MQFYDYLYRDSIIHKLDPRTKLLWLVALSFLVFTAKTNTQILASTVLLIATVLLSKLPINTVWKASRFFILTFTIGYLVLFSILLWNLQQGIIQGFWFAL
ncbi:MAG: CbiQ family ECF transporter T component, partial [Candidatus Woesearchaeota archaeon]|nr:CbiQ family ECF transporter T component [Candidatus Woesearchaeota archaeon]